MKRAQLEHVLRAAAQIADTQDIIVLGSQAILGSLTDEELPPEATRLPSGWRSRLVVRNARVGVLGLALLVTSCGTGSETASPPLAIGLAANLQFSCGIGHPFRADLFAQPGNAESANDPWSATLRQFLDRHAEPEFIPEHGWHLAGGDAQSATYVAPDAGGIGFVEVTLSNSSA